LSSENFLAELYISLAVREEPLLRDCRGTAPAFDKSGDVRGLTAKPVERGNVVESEGSLTVTVDNELSDLRIESKQVSQLGSASSEPLVLKFKVMRDNEASTLDMR